jgi:membrane-bound lytic murein transglycosylase D
LKNYNNNTRAFFNSVVPYTGLAIILIWGLTACTNNQLVKPVKPESHESSPYHGPVDVGTNGTNNDDLALSEIAAGVIATDTQKAAQAPVSLSFRVGGFHGHPNHIFAPDTGMPWWAVVAREEAESSEAADAGPSTHTPDNQTVLPSIFSLTDNKTIAQITPPPQTNTPEDLWQSIRNGFSLAEENSHFVKPYIEWYASHQEYLDRVVERARPFLYDIVKEIQARNMPTEIALLPVVESAFQPFAYSSGRAAGIWQFIPATGRRYGLKQDWWYDGRRDVLKATQAALDYLNRLQKRFDGDWLLALASYNTGEGRVEAAVRKNKRRGRPTDFWHLDLPDETQGYVPKLLAISAIVKNPEEYNITLASIPNKPYLERINIGSQIDLALAAELANMTIEDMYALNPAFNRWATDPDGPFELALPIDKADGFRTSLSKISKKDRIHWKRHRIHQGETLGQIAHKYQTTVALLQEVNNIDDKWIRAGDSIIIPVATRNLRHYLSKDQRRLALQHTRRRGIKITHRVRKGDTFWDLSRKFKVNVGQLASWNGMSPRDSLMPGQKLVIWTRSRNIMNARYAAPPSSARKQHLQYTVRKGDSLALIAKKFSVTVNKLRRWNSLPKGKYLQPGQLLTLYVDVTEQS